MTNNNKRTTGRSNTSNRKSTYNTASRSRNNKSKSKASIKRDYELIQDIKIILVVFVAIFLFVCNFGLIGSVGDAISNFLFGIFGVLNYIAPLFIAFLVVFSELFGATGYVYRKDISLCILFVLIDMVIELINGVSKTLLKYSFTDIFKYSFSSHKGGGLIAASITYGLLKSINKVGTILVITVLALICILILSEKSLINSVRNSSIRLHSRSNEDKELKREIIRERREEADLRRLERKERLEEQRKEREASALAKKESEALAKSDEKVLRKNRKSVGVTFDTKIVDANVPIKEIDGSGTNDEVHEITLNGFEPSSLKVDFSNININKSETEISNEVIDEFEDDVIIPGVEEHKVDVPAPAIGIKKSQVQNNSNIEQNSNIGIAKNIENSKEYVFPPRNLLSKGTKKSGDSAQTIQQTAQKLQETLAIFGVEATVTDISQGPTVTRFELQPKLGVKVSRIKSLSDDIKLNLAASEIRIEAPIPGKAAIGIEVPNKEAQAVLFRDLIDTNEYNNFNSNLAFAVGKDISGKTIVYGIENFPHLLIAGATGSGKSVCINTLIMSIIYKANPDDVKLIMIDPKVVELSVYNGIPHLMLPVVTDVKKASATLGYAVNEMQERYKKFAEFGARDLAGYNRVIEEKGEDSFNKKLPHIVIIVDEVADLMLQERKNVEDSICSLAQLARAAGIHLIIATQRPSVDVITGLIKANMPSRIAFAVSSNVDSRTILDMGGAEELLGKGDMLFFPKGLKKPVRLQGGFISDKEVNDVVEFLRKSGTPEYDASIDEKIKSFEKKSDSGSSSAGLNDSDSGNDEFFREAGFFIIDSNKASIGMLQRKFKMGFNRAARIMDQLADAGVVGPDLGTKPREILMSHESFENYLEEYGG